MINLFKEHKTALLLSSLLILLPIPAGSVLWSQPDSAFLKLSLIGMPILLLVLHWAALAITMADRRNQSQSRKVLSLLFWLIPACSLLSFAIICTAMLDLPLDAGLFVPAALAILFIAVGNLMPKMKQNAAVGIRVRWTLGSRENWNRTHRFSGRLWVAGGFLLLLALVLPGDIRRAVTVGTVLLLAVIPLVYSFCFHREQMKSGTAGGTDVTVMSRTGRRISALLLIAVLTAVSVLMFTGHITAALGDEALTVEASWYQDVTVPYDRIDRVEYRESFDGGTRTMGFGSSRLMMGLFTNDEFGAYTRYTYAGKRPCAILFCGDEVLVLGLEAPEQTQALFADLQERLEQ